MGSLAYRSTLGEPNYVLRDGGVVASATRIPFSGLDEATLAEHLLWSFQSDPKRTVVRGLERVCPPLPPAGTYDERADDTELASVLWSALRRAVSLSIAGANRIAIALGGIDSSGVLAAACELRPAAELMAFTFDLGGGADVPFAQELCRAFGVRLEILRCDDAPPDLSRALVVDGLPYPGSTAIHELHFQDELRREGIELLLTGGYGDDILGGNEREVALSLLSRPLRTLGLLRRLRTPYDESLAERLRMLVAGPMFQRAMPRPLLDRRVGLGRRRRAPWLSPDVFRLGKGGISEIARGYLPALDTQEWTSELIRRTTRVLGPRAQVVQQGGTSRADVFLEQGIFSLASAIPYERLCHGGQDRGLFRRALPARVPERVRRRISKAGAYEDLARLARQRASSLGKLVHVERLAKLGFVDPSTFVVGMHARGIHDVLIWPVLSAEAFLRGVA